MGGNFLQVKADKMPDQEWISSSTGTVSQPHDVHWKTLWSWNGLLGDIRHDVVSKHSK
jgi:hypothetical protein